MDWQIIITIASILTAVGVIIGFASKWGGAIAKLIVRFGWKNMTKEETSTNMAWQQHTDESRAMMEVIAALGEKLDIIHNDLCEDRKMTLKLELKDLFKNHPERIDAIESAYDDYHMLHGNSYIEELHEEWKKTYLDKLAKKEVKKE